MSLEQIIADALATWDEKPPRQSRVTFVADAVRASGEVPDRQFAADVRLVAIHARKNTTNHLVRESAERLLAGRVRERDA